MAIPTGWQLSNNYQIVVSIVVSLLPPTYVYSEALESLTMRQSHYSFIFLSFDRHLFRIRLCIGRKCDSCFIYDAFRGSEHTDAAVATRERLLVEA